MRYIRFYLAGSIAIGLFQLADSLTLLLWEVGLHNFVFSWFEYGWLPLSIVAVVFLVKEELPLIVPVSYLVYNLLVWLHAFYMVSRHVNPEHLRLPSWVALFGMLFGGYFAAISYYSRRRLSTRGVA